MARQDVEGVLLLLGKSTLTLGSQEWLNNEAAAYRADPLEPAVSDPLIMAAAAAARPPSSGNTQSTLQHFSSQV